MKLRKYGWAPAAAVLTAGIVLLTGCGQNPAAGTAVLQNTGDQVIRVSSQEEVKVAPDIAEFVYSVYSQASDVQTCQTQNETDLKNVLDVLKQQGVADSSIQTSAYGMNPIYDWNAGKTITGYEMTTQVTVSDIPMENAGKLLSASVSAGINSIESVTYKSSKYDETYQAALAKSIDAAKVKAQAMAQAGGCKLGKIVNIEEYGSDPTPRYTAFKTGSESNAAAPDMQAMPGEISVKAKVNISFAIE